MSQTRTDLEWLQEQLGLHEDVTVYYAVDGYIVRLETQDGGQLVGEAHGTTLADALKKLRDYLGEQSHWSDHRTIQSGG